MQPLPSAESDLAIFLSSVDKKLHKATDLNTVAVLSAEIAISNLHNPKAFHELQELLEAIKSNVSENAKLIHEVRDSIKRFHKDD